MEKLSENIQVFESDLDFVFESFLEKYGYNINSQDVKKIPNSLFVGAFRECFNKVLKPQHEAVAKLREDNAYLNLKYKPDDLLKLTNWYVDKVYIYNIVSFIDIYTNFLGINNETFYSWLNNNNESSIIYYNVAQKIRNLGKEQVRNKLSDDRTGVVVLANNDLEIGLEYNNKRAIENESAKQLLQIDQLPNFRIPEKTENP